MEQIKFAEQFEKFIGEKLPFKAKLLQVFTLSSVEMSFGFQCYDATYKDENGENTIYDVNGRYFIVLLLQSETGNVFTTVRRHRPDKYKYYKNLEGKVLEMIKV